MGAPTRQASEEHSRQRDTGTPRGAREQAVDVALRCFVDTVGADSGAVITRGPGGTRMLSNWAAEGAEVSFSWTSETLTGRAFEAGGPLVDVGPGGAAAAAVAAPFEYGPGAHG